MANALSADPRGLKRICLSCSTRFYDLNKRPINCPNCATEYTGEIKIKTRRGRLPAEIANDEAEDEVVEKVADEDEDELEAEAEAEVVSLEDVEKADDGAEDDAEAVELDAEELDDDEDDLEDLDDDDDDLDVGVDVDEDK